MMDDVEHSRIRSYGQFCGLARALDLVGDRWNLLIVRVERYEEKESI